MTAAIKIKTWDGHDPATLSDRIGDWMQTYSGGVFYPLDPRPDEIRFEDIAAALSKLCRYGGHCHKFYSVAEHCVHVAAAVAAEVPDYSPVLQLTALLHDASEAYLQDVIRPVKPFLTNYIDIEAKLETAIAQRFGLQYPLPAEIKSLDNRILIDEMTQAMARPPKPWRGNFERLGIELKFWSPAEAKYQFTTAFYRYGGRA